MNDECQALLSDPEMELTVKQDPEEVYHNENQGPKPSNLSRGMTEGLIARDMMSMCESLWGSEGCGVRTRLNVTK